MHANVINLHLLQHEKLPFHYCVHTAQAQRHTAGLSRQRLFV